MNLPDSRPMPDPPVSRRRLPLFWRIQLAGWGLFMLFGFIARIIFMGTVWKPLVLSLLMEPTSLLLSCGLRWLYQRTKVQGGFTLRNMLIITVASTAPAVLQVAHNVAWTSFIHWDRSSHSPALILRFEYYWSLFTAWSVGYLWLKAEYRSRAEREQAFEAAQTAQRAELQILRLQLNPHFMFNALNNIATEVLERPQMAHDMICRLANFLRYSFDHEEKMIEPLAREVEAMGTYLAIEEERFGGNLKVKIEADPTTMAMEVPCFLLQPLVENAVKHGQRSESPPWELGIKVWREENRLWIQVYNSGRLIPEKRHSHQTGMGLSNLRRRLELHFPSRHRLDLRESDGRVYSEIVLDGMPFAA